MASRDADRASGGASRSVARKGLNEAERLAGRILPVVVREPDAAQVPSRLKRLNCVHMRDDAEEAAGAG